MIYYISDIHFNDQRVFDKCKKPFKNLIEYENEVIKRWNRKVKNKDTIYVLGDIVDGYSHKSIKIYKKLNGNKHLVIGNHDENLLKSIKRANIFSSISFITEIIDKKRKVCLCHYPLMDWIIHSKNTYHIYGHIHNKSKTTDSIYGEIKEFYKNKKAFNASVDVINYEPVTLDEMIILKEKNKYEPYIN